MSFCLISLNMYERFLNSWVVESSIWPSVWSEWEHLWNIDCLCIIVQICSSPSHRTFKLLQIGILSSIWHQLHVIYVYIFWELQSCLGLNCIHLPLNHSSHVWKQLNCWDFKSDDAVWIPTMWIIFRGSERDPTNQRPLRRNCLWLWARV